MLSEIIVSPSSDQQFMVVMFVQQKKTLCWRMSVKIVLNELLSKLNIGIFHTIRIYYRKIGLYHELYQIFSIKTLHYYCVVADYCPQVLSVQQTETLHLQCLLFHSPHLQSQLWILNSEDSEEFLCKSLVSFL